MTPAERNFIQLERNIAELGVIVARMSLPLADDEQDEPQPCQRDAYEPEAGITYI